MSTRQSMAMVSGPSPERSQSEASRGTSAPVTPRTTPLRVAVSRLWRLGCFNRSGAAPDARPCRTGIRAVRNVGLIRRPLSLPDKLIREVGEALTDGPGLAEAHRLLVAGLAEEALAGPEHDREDDQPQLVDEVMLD